MRQRVGFKANLTRREDIIKPGNIRFSKHLYQPRSTLIVIQKACLFLKSLHPNKILEPKVQTFNQNTTLMI